METKKEMKNKGPTYQIFNFYPGSFWLKRMLYILTLFSITANIYLDRVQEQLLQKGKELLEISNTLYERADSYARDAGTVATDLLAWIERHDEKQANKVYYDYWEGEYKMGGWQIAPFLEGLVNKHYGRTDFRLPSSKRMKADIEIVHAFGTSVRQYVPFFEVASTVIRWTSIAIWFPILSVAAPWLVLHLTYADTSERWFTFKMLALGSAFNSILYSVLEHGFDDYIQGALDNIIF